MRGGWVLDLWHSISSTESIMVPPRFPQPFVRMGDEQQPKFCHSWRNADLPPWRRPFQGAGATLATGTQRDRHSEVKSPSFMKKLDGPLYLCLIFINNFYLPSTFTLFNWLQRGQGLTAESQDTGLYFSKMQLPLQAILGILLHIKLLQFQRCWQLIILLKFLTSVLNIN